MNCPTCKIALVMAERSGVEIDYCPQCRGVWLDRGELDKIIERSTQAPFRPAQHDDNRHGTQRLPQEKYDSRQDGHDHHKGKHGKRKSWVEDIFDF